MKKIIIYTLSIIILLLVIFVAYVYILLPNVSNPPDIKVEMTEKNIKRGEYLANNVALCIDCHSEKKFDTFSEPYIKGTEGKGGYHFSKESGFPGDLYSPNLTPFNLRDWTDGEIYRAITSGVSKNGRPLFPIMPYPNYSQLSKNDIYAIIAYIRTLPSIENQVPISTLKFPLNIITRFMPKDPQHLLIPDTTNKINYGKYLFTTAACNGCHTKMDKGQPLKGMENAGGMEFKRGETIIRSSNITPDKETGIGNWSKQYFIERFKNYTPEYVHSLKIEKNQPNTVMGWSNYSKMTDEDLGAIYDYLMTFKPLKNKVQTFEIKK